MKRLEQIIEEYAKTRGYESWDRLNDDCLYDRDLDAIATIYAREVAQASLEKAAENAKMKYYNGHDQVDKVVKLVMIGADNVNIDKESIINEQNITLL